MAGQQPQRTFYPITLGGALDEASTPTQVGHGLTLCENHVYRRFGAWGKRPGSGIVYAATPGNIPTPPTPPTPPGPFTPPPPTPPSPPPPPPGSPPLNPGDNRGNIQQP